MCEQKHCDHGETEVETGRLETAYYRVGHVVVTEGMNQLPMAEMAAVCGCGACGLCRLTFVSAVAGRAVGAVRNFFGGRSAEETVPATATQSLQELPAVPEAL